MKRMICVVLLLVGCGGTGVTAAGDAEPQCEECQSTAEHTACIRKGVALSSGARWLTDVIDSGGDATEIEAALEAVLVRADDFDDCAAILP